MQLVMITILYRDMATSSVAEYKWMVMAGPVDSAWIENLNTVLDDNRKLCSFYLSLMNRMGLDATKFGDADSPLADL